MAQPQDRGEAAAGLQLVREWSDPVSVAHLGWYADTAPALLGAAVGSPAGRQFLGHRLRQQVPLPARWGAAACTAAPWALGPGDQLMALAEHAGWLLLRQQVVRVVSRHGIENIVAQVGRSRYEAAFAPAATLWLGPEPAGLPELTSAADVALQLRSAGWCAINQVLGGELVVLRSRMHLVAGPQCATLLATPPWAIDAAQLIEALQGFASEAWH